jgi:pyruvate,water dikinase
MVVEFVSGLADRLVAGDVDPERLRIDRQTGMVVNTPQQSGVGLAAAGVRDLANIAERLERELGTPQDVEWVIDAAGVVHVVQSRPITAALNRIVDPPAANTTRVAWSNSNVTENFPQPISPFLYSIASQGYTNYFRNLARGFGVSRRRIDAMTPSLGRIIGVHGARMYYNLSSIHRVLLLVPFGRALASAFDTFVGTRDQDATGATTDRIAPRGKLREAAEVVVIAARTTWQYLFLGRRVARFERTVNEFAARTTPQRLARMPIGELRRSLAAFMDIRCNRWNDAALADAAAMVCYATLERLLRTASRFVGSATPSGLLKAIPNVVSAEPAQALWSLSRLIRRNAELRELFEHEPANTILRRVESDERFREFHAAFADYLERWGIRCSAELMLTVPSFQEEPQPVIELLRAYARLETDSPAEVQERQARERERETARLRAAIVDRTLIGRVPAPLYAWVLGIALSWTHASIRYRERARLKQALLYSRCRRIALAMGAELTRRGILDRRDDVFWLTIGEVEELAAGGAMLPHATRALVALRSRAHAEIAANTPPPSFELGEGEYLPLGPRRDEDVRTSEPSESLVGTPACGGRVTARATVLADISEAARLERGDILVTRQSDPGWAPAFFLISGLIVERGGMLSHGAIVAREFGIPCVVGVRDATTRISSGSTITLDGETGRVDLA